jgi:hypothetical protein
MSSNVFFLVAQTVKQQAVVGVFRRKATMRSHADGAPCCTAAKLRFGLSVYLPNFVPCIGSGVLPIAANAQEWLWNWPVALFFVSFRNGFSEQKARVAPSAKMLALFFTDFQFRPKFNCRGRRQQSVQDNWPCFFRAILKLVQIILTLLPIPHSQLHSTGA